LQVVIYPSETEAHAKTRLLSAKAQNDNISLDPQEAEELYLQLVKITRRIQTANLKSDEKVSEQVKGIIMEDFDIATKNLLINKISQNYLPFADGETFNETIGQQFKYLEQGYDDLNKKIFDQLRQLINDKNDLKDNDTSVNTRDIANRITSFKLSDLTLTLQKK